MSEARLDQARRRALAALIPPPRLRLSEWIEKNMQLPEGVSALPGRVRLFPFQRGIADAIGDPQIERVTLVKPVRVGFTTLLTGSIASFVANDPAQILALLPTEADCRDYVVSDLEPIFEATPAVAGLLSDEADETGRNTLMSRRFAGGSLKIVPAKAPRNLRRHNVRVLLIDEADGMEPTKEGDPLVLAERRTLSFADRKIIVGSTPTFDDTSAVLKNYRQSDMRVFEVPCPDCGSFTEIEWGHIEWQEDRPETAAFRCPHCQELIEERHKPAMVEAGRWRATRPEIEGHAGFRLNALVSLLANASWAKLAAEFVAYKDDPLRLQTFVNTILGQGWQVHGEQIDEVQLAARAEPVGLNVKSYDGTVFAIPETVLSITCGVDVQHDRLEMTFIGHEEGGGVVILGASVIWAGPEDETAWLELDAALGTRWPHPLGGTIGVDAAIVDSGDGATVASVYAYTFPRWNKRIFAGKGVAGFSRPWVEKASKKLGGVLWLIGVDSIKEALMTRLSRGTSVRFSASLPPVWFEQLASERRVIRYRRGQPERSFQRIPGKRAEALDCTVYALAAARLVQIDPVKRRGELSTPDDQKVVPAPAKPKSGGWLGDTRNFLGGR